MWHMRSAGEYRVYAEQCVEWAKVTRSEEDRDALLEMARAWLDAAHSADQLRVARRTTPSS